MPRVLVVDDNESIRRLVTRVLERHDIDVEEAVDGVHALQKLEEAHYDTVVLDLMMPRQSGYDVIKTLQRVRPEILKRTVVMTAAAAKMDHDLLKNVQAVVSKPFAITDLADVVANCIKANEP
jgi:CheY-like chemotaxis protein